MDELKNTAAQAAGAAVAAEDEVVTFKRPSQAKEIWRRFRKNRGSMIGLIILIIIFLLLIFAEFISPYEIAIKQIPENILAKPSAQHPFGCDA